MHLDVDLGMSGNSLMTTLYVNSGEDFVDKAVYMRKRYA